MRKIVSILAVLLYIQAYAQESLPAATVRNMDGTIIISWLNEYEKPIQNILIQRSFDSLKNFTTIGTVLNPANKENGYPDNEAPFSRMYYRMLITFEGGSYVIGPSFRPTKEIMEPEPIDITAIPKSLNDPSLPNNNITPNKFDLKPIATEKNSKEKLLRFDSSSMSNKPLLPKKIIETVYPSNRIYTSKQSVVVIHLTEYDTKKYQIRFFDESEKQTFEIKKITDEFLYIDKSNFVHSGWFRFEIFENGELYEKNKVFISKDKEKTKGMN